MSVHILCEIDPITPSSLQLVPVTRIEEIGDERGEFGLGRRIPKDSHGEEKIYKHGVTSV